MNCKCHATLYDISTENPRESAIMASGLVDCECRLSQITRDIPAEAVTITATKDGDEYECDAFLREYKLLPTNGETLFWQTAFAVIGAPRLLARK